MMPPRYRTFRSVAVSVAGAALALTSIAGCVDTLGAPTSSSPTTPTLAAIPLTSTAHPTVRLADARLSGPAAVERPLATPECNAATLNLGLHFDGAAAGSTYQDLVFTNVSAHNCLIVGFPGVSFVAGADGHQVGAAATWSGVKSSALILTPGESGYATVQQANSGNYEPAVCEPTPVLGFRVYAPDDRAAMYIPYATTACANPDLPSPQLQVQTIKPQPANG